MRTWTGLTVTSSSLSTHRCSEVLVGCISPSTSELACRGLAVAPARAAVVDFLCPAVL